MVTKQKSAGAVSSRLVSSHLLETAAIGVLRFYSGYFLLTS